MTSLQSPHNQPHERGTLMFASLTAKVVTAVCAVVGAIALLATFFMTLTGGLPYVESGLAVVFFAAFLVGSYWWRVFGPGRRLQGAYACPMLSGLRRGRRHLMLLHSSTAEGTRMADLASIVRPRVSETGSEDADRAWHPVS